VYAASHDLQGSLTNRAGLLHALRDALPAADQPVLVTTSLDLLHDSAERFQHTLTQFGAIARAQAEASLPASPVVQRRLVVKAVAKVVELQTHLRLRPLGVVHGQRGGRR
jgi:signal transduction histidine kinase